MTFNDCGFSVQGLSQATDISSSDEEVRQAGIKLLTGAIEVSILIGKDVFYVSIEVLQWDPCDIKGMPLVRCISTRI